MSRRRPETFHRIDLQIPAVAGDEATALLWALDCQGIEESENRGGSLRLTAYFAADQSGEALVTRILERFPDCGCRIETEEFDLDRWLRSYRETFTGFAIDETFYIRPPWDSPSAVHPVNIVLEPGHGFGTGTHESTRLALSALRECLAGASTFLDVGTGSGILAAAAGLLRPDLDVTALDVDPLAVDAARETLQRNRVQARLLVGEVSSIQGIFDVVVANLTGPLLRGLARDLNRLTGGRLVVSGFTDDESDLVRHRLASAGPLSVVRQFGENGWCCLSLATGVGGFTERSPTVLSRPGETK